MKCCFLQPTKWILLGLMAMGFSTLRAQVAGTVYYREKFRPQFHFTPQKNWMNDPNGLIYHNGEYHLYYQHNPFRNLWGHMSWGHATSRDLLHWKSHPLALREEEGRMAFSGSVVADPLNRSGFAQRKGETPLVAVYTRHDSLLQNQYLGISVDQGKSFQNYTGNPVLDLNLKDFR
ncbi:MAG: glycoside hydrolase family 32 protein, partial [Sphingobacteriia bacterium]